MCWGCKHKNICWLLIKSGVHLSPSSVHLFTGMWIGVGMDRIYSTLILRPHILWWIIYCKLIMKCPLSRMKFDFFTVMKSKSGPAQHTRNIIVLWLDWQFSVADLDIERRCKRAETMIISFVLMESSFGGRESLRPKQIVYAALVFIKALSKGISRRRLQNS